MRCVLLGLALLGVAVVSCTSLGGLSGGGDDAASDGGPEAAGEDVRAVDGGDEDSGAGFAAECESYDAALCARIAVCAPGDLQREYGTPRTCVDRATDLCMLATRAPGTRATPRDIRSCADLLKATTCSEIADARHPAPCNVPGALLDGAACVASLQCASGLCAKKNASGCGACTPRGGVGAPCADGCAIGLVCGDGTCQVPVPLDGACGPNAPCSKNLRCAGGTCARYARQGEDCAPDVPCDPRHGLVCSGLVPSTCIPVNYTQPGGSCAPQGGIPTECSGGLCVPPPGGQGPPVCAASIPPGGACSVAMPPPCMNPARCIAGQCLLPEMSLCGP